MHHKINSPDVASSDLLLITALIGGFSLGSLLLRSCRVCALKASKRVCGAVKASTAVFVVARCDGWCAYVYGWSRSSVFLGLGTSKRVVLGSSRMSQSMSHHLLESLEHRLPVDDFRTHAFSISFAPYSWQSTSSYMLVRFNTESCE